MTTPSATDSELLAYLDEMLPVERMSEVEKLLRNSEELRRRAALLSRQRDDGVHSVGEIWRRSRLTCANRSELGGYLLGTLDEDARDYIEFHIHTVGCRLCAANLQDLEKAMQAAPEVEQRRRKFFQSSAGHLRQLGDGE